MEGNFRDGKNSTATIVETIIFIVGFIATLIISLNIGRIFILIGAPVHVLLVVAVVSVLSRGKFSADEKSVAFSLGFKKYRYFYTNITDVRTEITFTNVRGNTKIPCIELVLSLRSGKIVRFSDTVPSYESETLESLKKFQKNHQFTKLAEYIKLNLLN